MDGSTVQHSGGHQIAQHNAAVELDSTLEQCNKVGRQINVLEPHSTVKLSLYIHSLDLHENSHPSN